MSDDVRLPAELPEADASDMDCFVSQVQILLPVVGIDVFRGRLKVTTPTSGGPRK